MNSFTHLESNTMDSMHAAVRNVCALFLELGPWLTKSQLFEQHANLLGQHRLFLEQIKQHVAGVGDAQEAVVLAVQQTEWMERCFVDCKNDFVSASRCRLCPRLTTIQAAASPSIPIAPGNNPQPRAPPADVPKPEKTHQEPYQKMDPSGLFMFDTVPTQPSFRQAEASSVQTTPKRRGSEAFQDGSSSSRRKRPRTNGGGMQTERPKPSADPVPEPPPSREDVDDDDDSFLREVQELQEAKEAKRRKREEKKRKRESSGSDKFAPPSGQLQDMSIVNGHEPMRKRQKTSNLPSSPAQAMPRKRSRSASRKRDPRSKRPRR